jgi:hypothetical protein
MAELFTAATPVHKAPSDDFTKTLDFTARLKTGDVVLSIETLSVEFDGTTDPASPHLQAAAAGAGGSEASVRLTEGVAQSTYKVIAEVVTLLGERLIGAGIVRMEDA